MTIDRHRQDEAVVVVGVLADQVDAARRGDERGAGRRAEGLLELLARTLKQTCDEALGVTRIGVRCSAVQGSGSASERKTGKLEASPFSMP